MSAFTEGLVLKYCGFQVSTRREASPPPVSQESVATILAANSPRVLVAIPYGLTLKFRLSKARSISCDYSGVLVGCSRREPGRRVPRPRPRKASAPTCLHGRTSGPEFGFGRFKLPERATRILWVLEFERAVQLGFSGR